MVISIKVDSIPLQTKYLTSSQTAYNWIKKLNTDVENLPPERELDELYWFVGKKGTSETRKNVYLITMISRNPRLIVGFDVASDKSRERIQNIVDSSPEAGFYYTDGYLGYIDVVYPGKHIRNVRDKKILIKLKV